MVSSRSPFDSIARSTRYGGFRRSSFPSRGEAPDAEMVTWPNLQKIRGGERSSKQSFDMLKAFDGEMGGVGGRRRCERSGGPASHTRALGGAAGAQAR